MTTEQLTGLPRPRHARSARGAIAARLLERILSASAFLAVALSVPGCGDHDAPPETTKQAVKFDEVPDNVRAAATKAIPGVKLNEAWKNIDRGGKLHSYEIRGKNPADGKTREVRVSQSGEILEME
jgi:hypothetical protein